MIKNILKIFLFFLFFTTSSFACDIRFRNFGASPENFKVSPQPLTYSDPAGGYHVMIPLQSLCPSYKKLFGTLVTFFYLNNELVQIRFERHNFNDRALMDAAIDKYGNFKRTLGSDKEKWIGNYSWRYNKELATYLASSNNSGAFEKLEINSIVHKDKISQYFTEREKWKK
jgi:hypothetical protein